MARTHWLLNPHGSIASITIAEVIVLVGLIMLENCNKQKDLANKSQQLSAEESAGFLSRSLFIWLNQLFWAGYRRTLTAADLEPIDHVLRSSLLALDFEDLQNDLRGTYR